jgi:hypothetical protein
LLAVTTGGGYLAPAIFVERPHAMSFDFVELAKNFGPFVAFTVFFVWQGWQREKKMGDRITELEKTLHEFTTNQLRESTEAITRNTLVMESFQELVKEVRDQQDGKSKS